MNTTILLITVIVLYVFADLLPKSDCKINFQNAVCTVISFFISTYIIYYFFNALDFGFTLTYTQVMFIYLLAGKADFCNLMKRIKEKNDFKNN